MLDFPISCSRCGTQSQALKLPAALFTGELVGGNGLLELQGSDRLNRHHTGRKNPLYFFILTKWAAAVGFTHGAFIPRILRCKNIPALHTLFPFGLFSPKTHKTPSFSFKITSSLSAGSVFSESNAGRLSACHQNGKRNATIYP